MNSESSQNPIVTMKTVPQIKIPPSRGTSSGSSFLNAATTEAVSPVIAFVRLTTGHAL